VTRAVPTAGGRKSSLDRVTQLSKAVFFFGSIISLFCCCCVSVGAARGCYVRTMFESVLLLLLVGAQAEKFADRLRPLVDEVDGHLAANFRNVSDAVLLVGAPGTGKTALAMLLAEDASLRLERSPAGVILADGGRKIGRATFLPNFMRDDVLGTILVDCPSPTEPEEAVVAAEYAVLRTVQMLSKTKVIVVANSFSLVDGLDKEGGRRLKEFVKRFDPVAAVVASKGDRNGESSFAKVAAPVVEFPRPFRPGSPLETLFATSSSVRKALVDAKFTSFKPNLSPLVRCYITEMTADVLQEVIGEFTNLFASVQKSLPKVIETSADKLKTAIYLKDIITHLNGSNYSALAAELKTLNASSNRLDFLAVQLDWVRGLGMDTPLNMEHQLQKLIDDAAKLQQFYQFLNETANYKLLKEREKISEILKEQPFDNLIMAMVAFDLKPRPQLIGLNLTDGMKRDLNASLGEKLKIADWSDEGVVLAAPFVLLSEASKKFHSFNNSIILMASQTIFLDQDLLLEGKDLTLIAPEVQVVTENVTLTLLGRKGLPFGDAAAEGDGKAGAPGGAAGNLLIICTRIVGAENLFVRSVGGEGGPGQRGAPASQGEFEPEETLEFLEPSHNISSHNRTSGSIRLAFKEGRINPKFAGHGGIGGEGGFPGAVLIYKEHGEAKEVRTEFTKGPQGLSGAGGKGAAEGAKFTFTIADCPAGQCVQIATGSSVETVPSLEEGEAGGSSKGLERAVEAPPLTLRRFLYLYVGTVLSKRLAAAEEAQVVALVERLPELIRQRGGEAEGGLQQIEAEWAVMEREKADMKRALGRHLPLMHRILLAYAERAPGGRRLSQLIRNTKEIESMF